MRFALVFVFCSIAAKGQDILFDKTLSTGYLSNFRSFPVGDSVLFVYEENDQSHARWIQAGVTQPAITIPTHVFQVNAYMQDIYYYFLEAHRGSVSVKAAIQPRGSNEYKVANDSLLLPDELLIGAYLDENLFLVTCDKKSNHVTITEVQRLSAVNQKKIQLPFSITANVAKEGFAVIKHHSHLGSFLSHKTFKVIVDSTVSIVCDIRNPVSRTYETKVIVKDSQSDQVETRTVKSGNGNTFSSYVIDDKLFRVSMAPRKALLSIHDLKAKTLVAQKIVRKREAKFGAYYRNGMDNAITDDLTAYRVIKIPAQSSTMNVIAGDSGKYIIQVGTYREENGGVIVATNPIALLITAALTAANFLNTRPGIHSYFYFEWDSHNNTFRGIDHNARVLRMNVDQYEINDLKAGAKIGFKEYVDFKSGLLATYYDRKKKSVKLVYFSK